MQSVDRKNSSLCHYYEEIKPSDKIFGSVHDKNAKELDIKIEKCTIAVKANA
jgi:hypothetical protein